MTSSTPSRPADATLVHRALLYRNAEQLDRVLRAFVATAGDHGEPVLAALPPANLQLLRGTLGPEAPDVRFEDMTAVGGNPSCLLDLYDRWLRDHDGRACVIGESIWPGRAYAETVECLRHEALINHAFGSEPSTFLCPFDAERLDAVVLTGAELTHPSLVEGDGAVRVSGSYRDPLETWRGLGWPQEAAGSPVSEFCFAGDLGGLRDAVAGDPIARSLGHERLGDLVFVLNEAATNAVSHGDGKCTTRLWHGAEGIVAEVSYETIISDAAVGRRRPPLDARSGRGLWLINQVCDLVELRSGPDGTTLRMHLRDSSSARRAR